MKSGDRVEWYNLVYQVCEGVITGCEGSRQARMDNGYEVLVDPHPERVFPLGTLDKTRHERFAKALKQKPEMNPVSLIIEIRDHQEKISSEERLGLWAMIQAGFCNHCGEKLENNEQCKCMNDE